MQHQAGNHVLAVFDRVGERIFLAVKLDAADGAFPVGLLQRVDELVRLRRSRALHGVGDVIDLIIGGIAGIGGEVTELRLEAVGEGDRLRRHRDARTGNALIEHPVRRVIGVLSEGRVGRLRADAEHRDRHLLVLPLHGRLHADMGNTGDHHIRLGGLDLVEDRREVGGIRREADVIEHLQPDLGQAFLVSDVERFGPGGVLAHDDRRLHVLLVHQEFLGGIADRERKRGRGQIAVEGIFVLLVIRMHALADLVGCSARRDEGCFQPGGPWLKRQHDLADIACDDDVDLVLIDRALEGANGVGRRRVIVVGDDLDLASVDTALGVDLVGGHLRGLRDRGSRDRLGLGDDADLDGVCGKRRGCRHQGEGARPEEPMQ